MSHPRWRTTARTAAVGLVLLASLFVVPSAAPASVPANDDIDAAISIGSLPFDDALSTVEATTADDDPWCVGNSHTVWYAYTPAADRRVEVNTFGSDYDTTISTYTGSRGSLNQIACNDDSQGLQSKAAFDATAGTTYYIMAGSFSSSIGGNLHVTVREAPPQPPPPAITLSLDRVGSVDRQGLASISGSVTCNQHLGIWLGMSLSQTFLRRFVLQGYGGTYVICEPPSAHWKVSAFAYNGRFAPGPTHVEASAFTCNEIGCASDQKSDDLPMRGGR